MTTTHSEMLPNIPSVFLFLRSAFVRNEHCCLLVFEEFNHYAGKGEGEGEGEGEGVV